jgi:signal transduction histidine kinase
MRFLSSLTNRVFVASASLVVLSMGLAIYRVGISVAAQAEADLRTGLAEAASLVDELNRTQFADFVVKAQLIADLPVLRAAAALDDPPTVQPIAEDYQALMRADLFLVLGRESRVLARAGRVHVPEPDIGAILTACRTSEDGTVFWPLSDGVLHVAAFPLDGGLATLLVGSTLDERTASRIHAVTNSQIAFVADGHVVASSFEAARAAPLGPMATREGTFTIRLGDEDYVGRVQPLDAGRDASAPVALVLRSRTEHLRFLPTLRWHIAITGLAAVLVATFVAYLVARSVTRPLRALTGTMREMAATGDLARTMPSLGRWDDEDVRVVAATFRQLTGALDRFRREASTRDRLSSLGQLSAVVAHEIRNPLMIIKSAARRLRRSAEPEVAAIAGSIDEEVGRLNRVVADILDFARPIAFELAPADLDRLCRDAAQAVQASTSGVPIEVKSAVSPVPVVTDAERLRGVLVNVLSNAQQAIQALPETPPADGRIVLNLSAAPGDRWRISVTDPGPGIAPADLPRVFDPFFTTRRGGSGLGLAIARNIVEGLGGTITATSRLGEGTTVTIEIGGGGGGVRS